MNVSEPESRSDRAIEFFDFEKRHQLFAYTSSGFSSWRVMRNLVFQMHQQNAPTIGNVPIPIRLVIAAAAIAKLVFVLVRPPKADWVFKGCVSALRWRVGRQWLDPAIDPVLGLGYSAFKIVEINSSYFREQFRNAAFPSHLEPSAITLLGRVFGSLVPTKLDGFHLRVSDLLNRELKLDVAPSVLRLRVSTVIWQSKLYTLLLRRIKPTHVIVTNTGEYGLRLACSHLKIPFYEIQHGVFDPFHPDAIPEDVPGNDRELLIPDFLLARGQFWVDKLKGYRNGRVGIAVGSAIIDYWRDTASSTPHTAEVNVVVTTQGLAVMQFIELLRSIISVAPEKLNWRISLKLHPIYDNVEHYRSAFDGDHRVTIIDGGSEPNIYELLATSDIHLSISSACHFDALALGVPSLMLRLPTHENLLHALDPDGLRLLTTPRDVWSSIRRQVHKRNQSYYSEPGYVANVLKCIERPFSQANETQSTKLSHSSSSKDLAESQ